jgi:hypothetical protein
MSARELCSLRITDRSPSPPKGGQKRLQSNADEAAPKRSKTTNDNEKEESVEEEQQPVAVKKVATRGNGKKGKKPRYVTY